MKMYYYQKKLEESIAPFQPKTVAPKAKVASKKVDTAPTHLTIDEMLRVLSDKTPHMVIPVSEFFGWFKKQATTNEQILLTSFSSIVLPRLAAQLNRNANNPSKVLSILKSECTQKEKDLIARLAAEVIPGLAQKYAFKLTSTKMESQLWGSADYSKKQLYAEVNRYLDEKVFGFGGRETAPTMPSFYRKPPDGWKIKIIDLDDPAGGTPAISRTIRGIGEVLVIYSEGGIRKSFAGYRQKWSVYGDLTFIPTALCAKTKPVEGCGEGHGGCDSSPDRMGQAIIQLRDWVDIIKTMSQAHNMVLRGKP